MIVDTKTGSFRTQRQLPKMALIQPSIQDNSIILNAPGKQPLFIPIELNTNNKINCR